MELLNLQRLAGGALQEKVNEAMGRVLNNMQDPNTPWKKQRSISMKITFAQNEDRDDVDVAISVETKLAAVSPITTRMSVGTDLKTGKNFAYEYGKQVKGQMTLEDYQVMGDDIVDTETGEAVGKVVDLRAREA